jgi:hypothetical protein
MMTTKPLAWMTGRVLSASLLIATSAVFAQGYETPANLKASDFAPAALLQGANYKVDDTVTFEAGFPRFTLRSPYGTWQAQGREMLEVRVSELPAFKQMESISKTDEFGKAASKALAAPIEVVGSLIENPADTVGNVASGIGLIAGRIGQLAGDGVQRVGDRATGNLADQKPILKTASTSEGIAQPRTFTGDPLGYNQKRREWAQQFKVDPYTNNAALADKLGDFAAASFAGSFPVNVTLGLVVAPLSYTVEFNDAGRMEAYQYPAIDVEKHNTAKLGKMGIKDLPVRKLLRNKYFTPTLQTSLVLALESLGNVPGRVEVVEFASRAASDIEARYVINSVALLSKHGKTTAPLVSVKAADNVLTGKTSDGKLIVPVPLDFIPWVKPVEDFARRSDLQGSERWVLVSGSMTPLAKQALGKYGWHVADGLAP